jgi:hypothetical protein
MCCDPPNGRVEFEGGWLVKSRFIITDEIKALTKTKKSEIPDRKKPINFFY